MKTVSLLACLCLCLTLTLLARAEEAADPHGKATPEHVMLSGLTGSWGVEAWFEEPGASEKTSAGLSAESRTVVGGRFLQVDLKGEVAGHDFSALWILGYDVAGKKYTAYLCDSTGRGPMSLAGTSPDGGKTLVFKGEVKDAATGQSSPVRMDWKTREDFIRIELWGGPKGDSRLMGLSFMRSPKREQLVLQKQTRDKIADLSVALKAYETDWARYPENLNALLEKGPKNIAYYEGDFKDAWGRDLVYRENASKDPKSPDMRHPLSFDLVSYGADGKPGGEGADQDLGND